MLASKLADRLDAFLFRHDDVAHHHIDPLAVEDVQSFHPVRGLQHAMAFPLDHACDGRADQGLVIDNKHGLRAFTGTRGVRVQMGLFQLGHWSSNGLCRDIRRF